MAMQPKLPKIVLILFFTVIIFFASFLRFYNLNNYGPIFYDEGQYNSEAVYVKDVILWTVNLATTLPFSDTKAKVIDQNVHNFNTNGEPAKTGRPVHNILTAFGLFIFSSFNNPGNYIMAIFGVINVILTFLLAMIVTKSRIISLLAAAILAVLPLHVFYSRLTMAEMDSQLFFLLALIFYIQRIKSNNLLFWWMTSVFTTLALITNGDRFAFITPIIIEIILYKRKSIKQILIFGLVFTLGIIISELPYHFAFLLTHNYQIIVKNPSYLEQELWIFARLAGFGLKFDLMSLLSYPYMLLNATGYIFIMFLILGAVKTFRYKVKLETILLISASSTLLFLSLHSLQALRAISPILPLFAIEAAIGILFVNKILLNKIKHNFLRVVYLIVIVSVLLGELVYNSIPLLNYSSPFSKVNDYLNNQKATHVITTTDAILRSVNPELKYINYQNTLGVGNISQVLTKEPEFIVVNVQKYTIPTKAINLTKQLDQTTEKLEKRCSPVFSIDDINSKILIKLFAYEHNSSIVKTEYFINNFKIPEEGKLNIYSFNECMEKTFSSKN